MFQEIFFDPSGQGRVAVVFVRTWVLVFTQA
jgi:hypothetical protein